MIKKLSDNYLTKYYAFFGFLTFFVILIILFSFYIIGSPSAQRDVREDENAQDRIYNLATRITEYYQSKGNLPQKIDVFFAVQDESDQKILAEIEKYKIDYQKLDGYKYKLCAEFKTSNYPVCFNNGIKGECEMTPNDYNYYSSEFLHRAGYECNTYDATQGSYPIKANKSGPMPVDPIKNTPPAAEPIVQCGFESCHGLDLTCGSNIPTMCDTSYQSADRCRDFAYCTKGKNGCELKTDPGFEICKSCVQMCNDQDSSELDPTSDVFGCIENCLNTRYDSRYYQIQ